MARMAMILAAMRAADRPLTVKEIASSAGVSVPEAMSFCERNAGRRVVLLPRDRRREPYNRYYLSERADAVRGRVDEERARKGPPADPRIGADYERRWKEKNPRDPHGPRRGIEAL